MLHRKLFLKRVVWGGAGASLLAGAFYAGIAHAADPRLDQANDNVTKAIALLQAAENPDPKKEFGGHRNKAIQHLKRAQAEIAKAKAFADRPAPDGKPGHGHGHDGKPGKPRGKRH
jgi:hypothetical protein